jgi:perosamine synthetase
MNEFIPVAKPIIETDEIDAAIRVLKSGSLAQGEEVALFEEEFSNYLDTDSFSIAVNSGTSALHIGLMAHGIGPGDEVIVPSFTFAATANAVALTGATPVFVDIEPVYFNIDVQKIRSALTSNTKAIMPVHLYGHPANLGEITKLALEYDLLVFEDSAQAHGASIDGKMVGTFGGFAAFSFYPTKNMTTTEGGMIVTSSEGVAQLTKLLRSQGMSKQYFNEVVGLNNRMTNLSAAIGRVQLKKLEKWTTERISNAERLSSYLDGIETPKVHAGMRHVFHQYTIRIPTDRDGFAAALKNEFNIGTGIYYPNPCHQLPSLSKLGIFSELPETIKASKEVLSLPIHPSLSDEHLQRIAFAVNKLKSAGA